MSGANATLYSKFQGGDENGLGLLEDPTGSFEIFVNTYIQFDTLQLQSFSKNASISMGSTSGGEFYVFYGSSRAGVLGAQLSGYTNTLNGVQFPLPGYRLYRYISVACGGGTPLKMIDNDNEMKDSQLLHEKCMNGDVEGVKMLL